MCSFIVANWLIQNLTYINFLLQPRGPDATNTWQGYGFHFVHNLLHMTGERVLQPFHDKSSGVVALFNGEIYNWQDLAPKDRSPRTDGDVLISTYQRFGVRFAQHFDGEFALVLFDFFKGIAVVATDPFGTKPLWILRGSKGHFAVASYQSALTRILPEEALVQRMDPNLIAVFDITSGHKVDVRPASTRKPSLLTSVATFEFDLLQHKAHTRDWRAAFLAAVKKRAGPHQTALCLSDGYDSGAIALALAELKVPHSLYTVQAKENLSVVAERLIFAHDHYVPADLTAARLSTSDFGQERKWLQDHAERVPYEMRGGMYSTVDDKASVGLSWIYTEASRRGHRLFLSGSGADETISDYGLAGRALEFHSTLRGIFPKSLNHVFPWLNFFGGTQRDYLAKEETVAGAHGVESRYPFLDRKLVQEYLWLRADLKNSIYKAPIREYMDVVKYPFVSDTKKGFSADKNLAGTACDHEEGCAAVPDSSIWFSWIPEFARARGRACAADATIVVRSQLFLPTSIKTSAKTSALEKHCFAEVPSTKLIQLSQPFSMLEAAKGGVHGQQVNSDETSGATKRHEPSFPSSLGVCRTGRSRRTMSLVAKRWLASIRRLRPLQSAASSRRQGVITPVLSLAAANRYTPQHRAAFVTACMEENFLWVYCAPLLSSFAEVFRLWADTEMHAVLVAVAGVSHSSLDRLVQQYPFVQFVEFDGKDEVLSDADQSAAADNHRRMNYQSVKLKQYILLWQHRLLGQPYDFVVCMDSDMLMVKPFNHILESLAQQKVDVAFTYYDGNRQVPWGSAEEASRTKRHGYVRLQGGMLVMRNAMAALHWFARWVSLTESMLHETQNDGPKAQRWRDLYEEFKGPSQAALAFLLTRSEIELMRDPDECCNRVRTVTLEPLDPNGEKVDVRMLGVPAQYLNDAESTEDGKLLDTVHVVHLKGHWWRAVLPDGREDLWAPTRSYEWNREALELWRRHYASLGA